MQIRKVKVASGVIIIRAEEASGEDDVRRIELESRAEPRPEFHEAMGGLIGPALDMIEAPFAWKAVATISGVSVTHEEERGMGAVVTLLVPLECAPSPLVLNTPYLTSVDPNEIGVPILPTALCKAVIRVVDEALRYLDGDRAQGDLFAKRPDDIFDGEMIYRALTKHDADGVVEDALEQSAAEPQALSDGPVLDRPAHEVRAEFERIRAEAMHRQPVIKPARGRRPMKA